MSVDLLKTGVPPKDYTKEETQFTIFCIENVALHLHVDSSAVYEAFTKKSDILVY